MAPATISCLHTVNWPASNMLCCVPGGDLWLCLCAEGKAGSLVDEQGHFYKPVQVTLACVECTCQKCYMFVTFVATTSAPPDPLHAKSAVATASHNAAMKMIPAKVRSSVLLRCKPSAR